MITPDGGIYWRASHSFRSADAYYPLHMFCCGPCRIIVSRLDTSFLGIFSTQRTVVRLPHVTGITHHHQSIFSPPNVPTTLFVPTPIVQLQRNLFFLCVQGLSFFV